jgi:hypothetical protein
MVYYPWPLLFCWSPHDRDKIVLHYLWPILFERNTYLFCWSPYDRPEESEKMLHYFSPPSFMKNLHVYHNVIEMLHDSSPLLFVKISLFSFLNCLTIGATVFRCGGSGLFFLMRCFFNISIRKKSWTVR